MDELQSEGVETVAADTAETEGFEDSESYTLEDAVEALADDDEGLEAEESEEAQPAETITLSDGTSLTLEEVEKGLLLQADYTRKTTEVAEARKAIEAERTNLTETQKALQTNLQKLTEFVLSVLPAEPDYNLARTNPAAYVQQKTLREDRKSVV